MTATLGYDRDDFQKMIDEIMEQEDVTLSAWEGEFLESIRCRNSLSDRQWDVLVKIWERELG